MSAKSIFRTAAVAVAVLACPLTLAAQESEPEALIDGLNAVFGKHAGKRAAHTKGICVKGSFTPTPEAPKLTKAANFAAPVPLIGRFSLGGGNPAASDSQQDNVRGFALHFNLPAGGTSDLVMISAPVFIAKTPGDFLQLLHAVAPGSDGKPDKSKVDAYFAAHPESTNQDTWLKAHPVPASYTSADYFGVHAFTLTNAKGDKQVIKWRIVPEKSTPGLSAEEAKAKGNDFYAAELKDSLAKGPAKFDLFAVLGQPGDPEDDPTVEWPAGRQQVKMGTIAISGLEPDATCDAGIFDPNVVADGIEGSKTDKILPMRSLDYAVSYGRRLN
jgi:catalase